MLYDQNISFIYHIESYKKMFKAKLTIKTFQINFDNYNLVSLLVLFILVDTSFVSMMCTTNIYI